jgi:hydroxypyruvate isomerase
MPVFIPLPFTMNTEKNSKENGANRFSRRKMLAQTAGLAAAGPALLSQLGCAAPQAARGPAVTRGRINQSIVHWCFELFGEEWDIETTCQVARQLGCRSVELVDPANYPVLEKYHLTCAIATVDMSPDPPFLKGFNNPAFHDRVLHATREAIDAAAHYGWPNVICFTGYSALNPDDPRSEHLTREEGAENCVNGLKKIIGYAEEKNVNLCLEMLNTRDDTHPMKGHPGYQGDGTEYCIDIIQRVGSPRMKLLFDIYHVQIMDGDVIRRIHEHRDYIGHIHTAGNPGRGELDETQELYYPPIMRALLDIGYKGYVGQEFIPTRDPLQGLREAVALCDV